MLLSYRVLFVNVFNVLKNKQRKRTWYYLLRVWRSCNRVESLQYWLTTDLKLLFILLIAMFLLLLFLKVNIIKVNLNVSYVLFNYVYNNIYITSITAQLTHAHNGHSNHVAQLKIYFSYSFISLLRAL